MKATSPENSLRWLRVALAVLAGWNIALLAGLLVVAALARLGGSFWVCVAGGGFLGIVAGYLGAMRLYRWAGRFGAVGRALWLVFLILLSVVTFPGRFAYAP